MTLRNYVGIDPGLSGGIAILYGTGDVVAMIMPVIKSEKGHELDLHALREMFEAMAVLGSSVVGIEKAMVMPKQGSVSGFTIGTNYGVLKGLLYGARLGYQEVRPNIWKKAMGLPAGADKRVSILRAEQLFPSVSLVPERCRTPHDGMAEALLLAEWMRRNCEKEAAA